MSLSIFPTNMGTADTPWVQHCSVDYKFLFSKQVKQESCLTPSKEDHRMRCISEALQVQIYKSKR